MKSFDSIPTNQLNVTSSHFRVQSMNFNDQRAKVADVN